MQAITRYIFSELLAAALFITLVLTTVFFLVGSLGQAVTVRGTDGTLYASDDGTRTLLAWVEGERSYWVGGDLSAEQALAVAESLK